MNEFAANEIKKAGAQIDYLSLKKSVNLCRMIAKAKRVGFLQYIPLTYEEIMLNETYSEFPHLKRLHFFNVFYELEMEIIGAILARSQLEEFETHRKENETEIL